MPGTRMGCRSSPVSGFAFAVTSAMRPASTAIRAFLIQPAGVRTSSAKIAILSSETACNALHYVYTYSSTKGKDIFMAEGVLGKATVWRNARLATLNPSRGGLGET